MSRAIPEVGIKLGDEVNPMAVHFAEDVTQNEPLFRMINREVRSNPQSSYAGKWVALLYGRVVAVGDTRDEAARALRKIEPNRFKGFLFEANGDYETVDTIPEGI